MVTVVVVLLLVVVAVVVVAVEVVVGSYSAGSARIELIRNRNFLIFYILF